jgi:hypothetical protein
MLTEGNTYATVKSGSANKDTQNYFVGAKRVGKDGTVGPNVRYYVRETTGQAVDTWRDLYGVERQMRNEVSGRIVLLGMGRLEV